MAHGRDGDMTGQDPTSSAAEGDDDLGSAALAEAGSGHDGADAADGDDDADGDDGGFASGPPHPEAADDTPVTDAPPVGGPDAGS